MRTASRSTDPDVSLNTPAAWSLHWTARLLAGDMHDRPQCEVEGFPTPCRTCDGTGLLGSADEHDVDTCPDCAPVDDRDPVERPYNGDRDDLAGDRLLDDLERSLVTRRAA